MTTPKIPSSSSWSATCADPPAELRIALRPLAAVGVLAATYCVLAGLAVAAAASQGRMVVALTGAVILALLARSLWPPARHEGPAWLVSGGADDWRLIHRDAAPETVSICAGSLFLGRGVLLVLRGRRVHRLWLCADNVTPSALAALRRQLSQAAVRRGRRERKFLYWLE